MTERRFNRRHALVSAGTVTVAGVLAACGEGDETESTVTSTTGKEAEVQTKTPVKESTAELFDEGAACTLTAEQTEGPYYLDVGSIRRDIAEDRDGTPLRVALRVRESGSCQPLPNAVVDIWHCDAAGLYSGFESLTPGGPPAGAEAGAGEAEDATFLRGTQVTNSEGIVEFATIYPGRYPGRTTHIHAKVHLGDSTVLTTQLYFDDVFSERIHAQPAYDSAGGDTLNESDGLFDDSLVLTLTGGSQAATGVLTFDVEPA